MTVLQPELEQLEEAPHKEPPAVQTIPERHGYRADHRSRLAGMAGAVSIYVLALAGFFFTVSHVVSVQAPRPALSVFNVNQPVSPPEMPTEEKEAPKPIKEKMEQTNPSRGQPVERSILTIAPVSVPIPAVRSPPNDPGPVEPETAAPKTAAAPPAQELASNAPDTWEGRMLAALNKQRRYPRMAMARRQQGVPFIRFVMDRDGKVLSSSLERSSGFPALDREAVALPKRASPLPKPPADKTGDTFELVVPVEFFIR